MAHYPKVRHKLQIITSVERHRHKPKYSKNLTQEQSKQWTMEETLARKSKTKNARPQGPCNNLQKCWAGWGRKSELTGKMWLDNTVKSQWICSRNGFETEESYQGKEDVAPCGVTRNKSLGQLRARPECGNPAGAGGVGGWKLESAARKWRMHC